MPGDEAFYDNPEVRANYFTHRAQKDNFLSEEEYERRLRIPLFLFIAARKTK